MIPHFLRRDVCFEDLDEVVRVFEIAPYSHLAGTAATHDRPFTPVESVCWERGEVVGVCGLVGVTEIYIRTSATFIGVGDCPGPNIAKIERAV